MKYKVVFHPDAAKDLRKLDHRVKLLVFKQINKLSSRPELGKNLGAKHGIDLSGYRKIYADRKKIRIVYKILDDLVIIHILAVGKREGMEVYQKAGQSVKIKECRLEHKGKAKRIVTINHSVTSR